MSRCLVRDEDYRALGFGRSRTVITGLHGKVIGAIEPRYEEAPKACLMCHRPVDERFEYFCCLACSISAEND